MTTTEHTPSAAPQHRPGRARRRDAPGAPAPAWWGWAVAAGLGVLALFLRLWRLGRPQSFSFDETYYAKDAWSLVHHGYVRTYVEEADAQILDGNTTGLWQDTPSLIVHPEVGKWLIGAGERLFGMDPYGWRVAAAVVGSLMVVVLVRLALRLTGSVLLAGVAGVLLTFDGLQLVLSRLALLDIFLAFFTLCGVHCLVADRGWFRRRLAARDTDRSSAGPGPDAGARGGGWGPVLVRRPWLLAAGVCFGLAVGTKWTALYPLAAFGVLVWLWSAGARRRLGVRRPVLRSALVDGVPAFVSLVGVAALVYVATWGSWLVHAAEYEQHLADNQYAMDAAGEPWPTASEPDASGVGEAVQSLESLAYYHRDLWEFHTHALDDSSHTYASSPRGWLLLNRPVGVDAQLDIPPGKQGCEAAAGSSCLRQVLLLGTPVLWWGGVLALVVAVVAWAGRRDWRFALPVVGVASTWLPWLIFDDRPIFSFYAVLSLPFLVLGLVLVLGWMLGTGRGPGRRRTVAAVVGGGFVALVVLNFAWFWPIWTDGLITHQEWSQRMWFERWI